MSGRYLRPAAIERWFGRVLAALVRAGLVRSHFYVLEVRGRRSGRTIAVPVDPIAIAGRRYLVCPRGESNWVRNARTAGEVVLVRAGRREAHRVSEVPAALRAPVLKAYLDRFAGEVQRFFPVAKGSPVEAFGSLALAYPVFELRPLDGKLYTSFYAPGAERDRRGHATNYRQSRSAGCAVPPPMHNRAANYVLVMFAGVE